jgi:putative heme-binding domain-containing protein
MYPSKVVSDQYTGVEVELNDFSTVTGMVANEDTKTLTVITITGERVVIPKKSIAKRTESTQSMMPEGLLNTMTLQELVSLIYFLEHGAE